MLEVFPGPDSPEVRLSDGLASPEELAPAGEHPDARVMLKAPSGVVIAHLALWWTSTPELDGQPIGTIGGFTAKDAEAARLILKAAVEHLRAAGCRIAVGPMNGNTWRRHRFVIESAGRPPFLLEPRNPVDYPGWWLEAGFTELSRYSSSTVPLTGEATVAPGLRARLARSGVAIRTLDPDRYDDELRVIHGVCLKGFANNFLYTPLEEAAFVAAYQKVRQYVDPDLVRIAERDGIPCGFVFAVADLEAAARGEKPALIVKTLAVDPGCRTPGLGSLLVDEVQQMGLGKGFTEAIHALQHDANNVLKITGRHHGEILRRYALFARPIPSSPDS
jgi:GNAT superfamily N-acetyltransferase